MIFLFELSPNLTFPPSFRVREVNLFLSPVICLEHPLSRNHLSLVDLDIKHTYKTNLNNFLWYPILLGSSWVSWWCDSFNNPNLIFHGTCMNIMPYFSTMFTYGRFQEVFFNEKFFIVFFFYF